MLQALTSTCGKICISDARVKNENKKKYSNDPQIAAAIEEIEKKMEGNGRVLIRPSGTEPLVRVMIEGDDEVVLDQMARGLADLIEEKFMLEKENVWNRRICRKRQR